MKKERETRLRKGFIPEVHLIDDVWVTLECIQDAATDFCGGKKDIPIAIEEHHGKEAREEFVKMINGDFV